MIPKGARDPADLPADLSARPDGDAAPGAAAAPVADAAPAPVADAAPAADAAADAVPVAAPAAHAAPDADAVPPEDDLLPSFARDVPPIFEPGGKPLRGLGVPVWKVALAGLTLAGLGLVGWLGPAKLLGHVVPEASLAAPPAAPRPPARRPRPRPPAGDAPRVHVEPFVNGGGEAVLSHLERALADATALALKREGLELSLDERLRSRGPAAGQAPSAARPPEALATLAEETGAAWLVEGRFERRGDEVAVTVKFRALQAGRAGLTVGVERPAAHVDELPDTLAEAVALLAPALQAERRP